MAASGALVVMAGFMGSTSAPAGAATDDDLMFRVGVLQDIDNLNPFKGITAAAYESWALMYDTLTGYAAEDFAPEPRLAESVRALPSTMGSRSPPTTWRTPSTGSWTASWRRPTTAATWPRSKL
jgi:ABC-type transport system substrate-binding protein